MRWRTTAFAFDLSTMPLQSRWPLFELERVDLLAVGVEREREVLAVLDPEVAVEAALQVGGLLLELGRRTPGPSRPSRASRAPRTLAS